MTFQTQVRDDQATGIVGEFAFDGPQRAFNYDLLSNDAANNVFGRAFTFVDDETVEADSGSSTNFAGILVRPKEHALAGNDVDGSLGPSITLPNGATGQLCTMGQIFVDLLGAASVGDSVAYNFNTGELTAFGPAAVIASPQIQIPGAKVVRCNTAGPGTAIIQLTDQQGVNPTS